MNGKKTYEIPLERTVKVTQQDIDDIMVSALEGGIDYWCGEAEVIEDKRVADWGHHLASSFHFNSQKIKLYFNKIAANMQVSCCFLQSYRNLPTAYVNGFAHFYP